MELKLITGFEKPQAKLDPIFELKKEIVKFTVHLAYMRVRMPKCIPIAQGHPTTVFVTNRIRHNYYDLQQSIDFDKRLFKLMDEMSIGEQEGYKMVQFSDKLLDIINRIKYRPNFLPAPLYYENKKIKTLFEPQFYARFEKDVFGHQAIVMRVDGTEYYFGKKHKKKDEQYPVFTQPFLTATGIDRQFVQYGSTFSENYKIMKGLFNIWYGFTF